MGWVWATLWVIVAIVVIVDVFRSPTTIQAKVIWGILALAASWITAICWFAFGRKAAYSAPAH
jgi:Phospholipase_D-nuclease N-terminal